MGMDIKVIAGFGIEVCSDEVISAFGLCIDCENIEGELDDPLVEYVEYRDDRSGDVYQLLLLKSEFVEDVKNLPDNIEKMRRYLTEKGFIDVDIEFFKEAMIH